MILPFSRTEFLHVFAAYNSAIWPGQIVAAAAGLLAIGLLFRRPKWADRAIAGILAALWLVTGIGYHWMYFAAINPAAYLFGGLFVLEGALLAFEGTVRRRIAFRASKSIAGWIAAALIVYAVAIYPLVGLLVTHPYPQTPLFGVAPCPTTIFTLGFLILARTERPLLLAPLPLLWAVIGGSAALLLNMPEDFGLPVAAAWIFAHFSARRRTDA